MTEQPKPKSFAALHHRGFRAYFGGSMMAMMADSIEHVISYWILFEVFKSPALAGFAVISHWVPHLFLSVYSGALADRFDPRRIIQAAMGLYILVSLSWALLFFFGALEAWHAVVLLIIHGLAGVLGTPASQLLIHYIVEKDGLQSGIRLSASARWLGLLLGPAIGSALLLWLGPVIGLVLNAAFYLPLGLWLIRSPQSAGQRTREAGPRRAFRGISDIATAIRDAAANPVILSMILLAGAVSLFVGNAYHAQMPEFAHAFQTSNPSQVYSWLLISDGIGALTAGILLESRGALQARPRTAFILALMWCLAITGFALSSRFEVAMAALFIAGFLELAFSTMVQTIVQTRAPEALRGRIIGVYIMAALGLRAFSGLTIGFGGSLVGIHGSLAGSALLLMVLIAVLFVFAQLKLKPSRA
ncbi:MAG: MFS transporter [Proteobacteria bacterium]|nr:MFS transporter [Pseudomonadota bacterium]